MPTGDEDTTVSDSEADEMEEHLRGLGYLEWGRRSSAAAAI